MYTIIYEKLAQRSLQRMPRKLADSFIVAFEELAADKVGLDLDIKPLRGQKCRFRLRTGGWRAIYQVEKTRLIIYVVAIGLRGDVYRGDVYK